MATLRQIQETLSQATGAQFLFQPVIDRALFENKRKFTATRALFPRKTWNVPTYEFNKRTNYAQAQFVTEAPPTTGAGSVAPSSSTYAQVLFPVKHWQVNLDLAKFSIQTARVNGDLVQLELDSASKTAVWLEEATNFYGSAGATNNTKRPAWDGVDLLMASANKIAGGTTPNIAMLDAMIDAVKNRFGNFIGKNYAFVLSPEMYSAMGRLFIQFERWMGKDVVFPRDDRGQLGGAVSDNRTYIDGGLEVATYRGIPLVESSFIASLGQMTTVTASDGGGSGSSLTNVQYGYIVEVVTDYGISLGSAEATVTPIATHNVSLSWTAPAILDADGATRLNLFYRIHRTAGGGALGSETLYAVLAAYDATDTAVTSFTDTGLPITPFASGSTAIAATVATSGNNAAPDGVTTPRTNPGGHVQQDIWLLPRDPDILCVPVVNEMTTTQLALVNARTQQLALTGDQVLAVRGPNFIAKAQGVYVS